MAWGWPEVQGTFTLVNRVLTASVDAKATNRVTYNRIATAIVSGFDAYPRTSKSRRGAEGKDRSLGPDSHTLTGTC